jgi:hypothetical protein
MLKVVDSNPEKKFPRKVKREKKEEISTIG